MKPVFDHKHSPHGDDSLEMDIPGQVASMAMKSGDHYLQDVEKDFTVQFLKDQEMMRGNNC